MFGEKIAHDLAPCGTDFLLIETLGEPVCEGASSARPRLPRNTRDVPARQASLAILRALVCESPRSASRKGLRGRGGRDRGVRGSARLFAVVADCFDRTALFRLLAESLLVGRLRLLVDVAVAAVIVALEIRGAVSRQRSQSMH